MGRDCWRAWIQSLAQCRNNFKARGDCIRKNPLYPPPPTVPVIASWFIKLWMKLWIATQKGSIADRCLKGITSAAHALLDGSLTADGIFLSGLETSHICPAHRAENVLPTGTHPYQHKWLQKSSKWFSPLKGKEKKKKKRLSDNLRMQGYLSCRYTRFGGRHRYTNCVASSATPNHFQGKGRQQCYSQIWMPPNTYGARDR